MTTAAASRAASMAALAAAFAILAEPALAHHPMDGQLPDSLATGLLSGLGHPVIGLDHLAFVVAVGLAAGLIASPLLVLPIAFVALTVAGVGVHLAGLDLLFVEPVIAVSVIAAGGLVAARTHLPLVAWAGLFAVAGMFHGYAYGESIVGAETTPLAAYFIGFAAMQTAVAAGVALLVRRSAEAASAIEPRIAGGVVAGVGLVFAAEALLPF